MQSVVDQNLFDSKGYQFPRYSFNNMVCSKIWISIFFRFCLLKHAIWKIVAIIHFFWYFFIFNYPVKINTFSSAKFRCDGGKTMWYSCQHLLMRFRDEWRKYLDQNKIVGALLMDLSKALECLLHDLLIAKLEAYVFDTITLNIYLNLILIRKKQFVNINRISFRRVPQRSVLGPILFNIFNNLSLHIKNSNNHNTQVIIPSLYMAIQWMKLQNLYRKKSRRGTFMFLSNRMLANADKFQAIYSQKDKKKHCMGTISQILR